MKVKQVYLDAHREQWDRLMYSTATNIDELQKEKKDICLHIAKKYNLSIPRQNCFICGYMYDVCSKDDCKECFVFWPFSCKNGLYGLCNHKPSLEFGDEIKGVDSLNSQDVFGIVLEITGEMITYYNTNLSFRRNHLELMTTGQKYTLEGNFRPVDVLRAASEEDLKCGAFWRHFNKFKEEYFSLVSLHASAEVTENMKKHLTWLEFVLTHDLLHFTLVESEKSCRYYLPNNKCSLHLSPNYHRTCHGKCSLYVNK